MKWNRKKLLALLASQGFKAEGATLDTVKAFITEKNLELADGPDSVVDVDAAWKNEADDEAAPVTKTRVVYQEPTDYAQLRKDAALGQKARAEAELRKVPGVSDEPQRFSIGNAERKAYNAKVASEGVGNATMQAKCSDADTAELCGAWARLAFCKLHGIANPNKANDEDICTKANVTYDFASGGFAIPEIFRAQLINIRAKYSAITELGIPSIPIPPQGDSVPRLTGDHTVYSTSEGVALTESNVAGDQVRLTPFSVDILATITKKQLASSAINFGDVCVGNMRWAMDKKLEQIALLGDGSATYFNQLGIIGKLKKSVVDAAGTWPTNAAYSDNQIVAAGNSWGAITYANLMAVFGSPAMLQNEGPVQFTCSRPFFWTVIMPLMDGRGGATREEVANGMPRPLFQGVPGVYTNVLSQSSAASDIPLLVGEFNTAMKMGVVPELTEMSTSTEAYWVQRKLGFMFSMYHAINVHDVGTAHATAASRVKGPMSALVVPA